MGVTTIGSLARRLDRPAWQVRRYCDEVVPNVQRAGLYRLLTDEDAKQIEEAMRAAGLLSAAPSATAG
jgi:hypothetical protein